MMTKAFALNGAAKVYIVGRRKEKLDEAAKLSPHGNIIPAVGDVTSKDSLVAVANQVKRETGHIDLLICNSGTMNDPIAAKPIDSSIADFAKAALEQDPEEWSKMFSTNTTAVAFTTFAFLELLDAGNQKGKIAGRQSQVLVTTSIAGYLRDPENSIAYGLSKAAATHLIKHLAGLLVPYSIRVNGIAPGLFPSDLATDLIKGVSSNEDPSQEGTVEKNFVPATRVGKESDMAGTTLYMASAAGAYLNGNITVVDGGRIGQLPATY
jgi:NAD(P)-dependent dehydrogenase (short-subunit alcohol dehydrogenase family)